MSEYETEQRRQSAAPDAEPVHPDAELPRADREWAAATPVDASAPARPAAPQQTPVGAPNPASSTQPETASPSVRSAGAPLDKSTPVVPDGPFPPSPGYPSAGQTQPAPGSGSLAGYPAPGHPAPHPYRPGWSGQAGYPVPGQPPAVPVPSQQPYLGGGPLPPGWVPVAGPAPRPGRLGKLVAAGAAALVLMAGSGIAGGVMALAIADGSSGERTYTAAPIINSADLPAIAASAQGSVVSIATGSGEGSGVVLTADGYILTNNHVVVDAAGDTVEVVFANGKTARAKIVGTDPKTDLAVIKASGVSNLAAATFGDSDAMRVGDTVLALGSPLGLQGSVTAGIISAKDRTIRAGGEEQRGGGGAASISGLLQTDAPINPGNSGGALVSTRGEVIGINTAIATSGQGNGNIGLGFAIPSNKAKAVADALRRGERVSHPSLGVSVGPAEGGGALVDRVVPNSPADQVGLKRGDVITRFGDKTINDSVDLVAAVQAGKVGDRVELVFSRNGVENTATVTLAEAS